MGLQCIINGMLQTFSFIRQSQILRSLGWQWSKTEIVHNPLLQINTSKTFPETIPQFHVGAQVEDPTSYTMFFSLSLSIQNMYCTLLIKENLSMEMELVIIRNNSNFHNASNALVMHQRTYKPCIIGEEEKVIEVRKNWSSCNSWTYMIQKNIQDTMARRDYQLQAQWN